MFSFRRLEIEGDKANHFVYGSLATAVAIVATSSVVASIAICAVLAFGKEVWDWRYGSGFDTRDALWTLAGGICVLALELKKVALLLW